MRMRHNIFEFGAQEIGRIGNSFTAFHLS